MSTNTTNLLESEEIERMGVASLSSNKRRLESPGDGDEDYVIAAKVAKKASAFIDQATEVQDTIGNENSSDFLTTSILARTLLTSTATGVNPIPSCISPLESLSSTLEALPAPSLLLDGSENELGIRSTFLPFKSTIQEATDLEFTSLLCHERVTVLSPIDEDSGEWASSNGVVVVVGDSTSRSKVTNKTCNSSCLNSVSDQVITEDETGKSYFNLGSADTTILVKKSSSSPCLSTSSSISSSPVLSPSSLSNGSSSPTSSSSSSSSCSSSLNSSPTSPPHVNNLLDQSWTNSCNNTNSNNNTDFMDDGSSSSCESITSEDLFTSEEFDASEDEEEIRSYKQQRSNVLHISLCKLNSFRTQQCVEPSLHRSVLICNTLRHIEQEIRNEDEIPMGGPLPSFWAASSTSNHNNNHNPPNNNQNNNSSNNNSNDNGLLPNMNSLNQPQITDIRPNPSHIPQIHGHDPYLSPSVSYNGTEAPYHTSYDYRPNPTPFHTATYDYEQDLPGVVSPGVGVGVTTGQMLEVNSPLLECDSGYAEDLNLSSYYYPTNSSPRNNGLSNHSIPNAGGGENSSNVVINTNETSYMNCGYNLTDCESSIVSTSCPGNDALLLSDTSLLSTSDIEIHNSLSLPSNVERTTNSNNNNNCDYLVATSNNNTNVNSTNTSSGSSSSSSSSNSSLSSDISSESNSDDSISPPPSSLQQQQKMDMDSANPSSSSTLCWSKISSTSNSTSISTSNNNNNNPNNNNNLKELVTLNPPSNSPSMNNNNNSTFVQQPCESHQMCGMESRLSEFNRSHSNFNNPHHHNPMDSLISANYSNSL